MKRLMIVFLACTMLCGCTANSDPSSDTETVISDDKPTESSESMLSEKIDITTLKPEKGGWTEYDNAISYYTADTLREIVAQNTDYKISDSCFFLIPQNIDHVSSFHKVWQQPDSIADFYRCYMETFAYLFPDLEMDDHNLFYYGKNSNNSQGDEDVKTIGADFDAFIHEKPEDVYYLFYSAFFRDSQVAPADGRNVFLELSSPVGTIMTNFNKGVLAAFISDETGDANNSFLETYTNPNVFSPFDPTTGRFEGFPTTAYPTDAKDEVTLLDGKKIAICDAVSFYEDYINSLPYPKHPTVDMKVMRVNAVQVSETGKSCLAFLTTPAFEGVPFDYKPYGTAVLGSGDSTYEQYISVGYMSHTDDVDAAYGFGRGAGIENRSDSTQIVSFEDAVRCCKENMSEYAQFELVSVELVYCAGNAKTAEPPLQYETYDVLPCYKFVLYNQSDALQYAVYVNAMTGEFERYYTTLGDHT